MAASKLERLLQTDKQKRFEYDFLKDTEKLECWEDVVVGEEYDSEQTFEVTRDDLVMFAEASLDSNPLFHDEQAAQASPYGGLLPHPIFPVEIAFWCIGKGRGNWLRTPGAMNPGQHIVWYEPLHVGDTIRRKEPERMENSILPKDSKGLATELEGRISLNLSWRAGSRPSLLQRHRHQH